MDQQHPFNPAAEHPEEARGTPASTVVSEGEWLAVSTEGFSEQQRGRPLEHLVKKLVQNAMDSVGDSGRINLDIKPIGPRQAVVCCIDDGLGAEDLPLLNGVVATGQKDGVTRRGRMGCRFSKLPSIVKHAIVRSHGQEMLFVTGDDGSRRVTNRCGLERRQGFDVAMHIEHDEAGKDLGSHFHSVLPPAGVVLVVNGVPVPARPVHKTVNARLPTERFSKGRWEKPVLATRVHLVAAADGERAMICEMGVPVCDAGWNEPFHIDVCQRVPMNPSRDGLRSGYRVHLHKACLSALVPEMTPERARAFWVGEAAQSADDGVQKAVVAKAFGERVVQAVPATRKFDHNADAERLGYAVVQSTHLTSGFRRLLHLQVPTAAVVARKAMRRRAETAVEIRLGRADVAALDPAAEQPGAPDAARAIMRFGREAVLIRMDFARWFAEAVVECRHRRPRAVPVQVTCLEAAATWSLDDVLTLSLTADAFWQKPFGRASFELLLHKLAHNEAHRQGRSFSKEVEAYAGAAVEVMLARADEAGRLFPELLSGSPGRAPAAPGEPDLDDPS